ncbi:MAG: hypothetical protein MK358_13665, partial [Vicinamibacterales bacterium]|nr:hypothetical protein [Vicinamibacterales bacterium]
TGRERDEDGGEGDGPSVASSHGLSSDDHDDTGVDADPTAGEQGMQCGDYGSRGYAASHARARTCPQLTSGTERSSHSTTSGGTTLLSPLT